MPVDLPSLEKPLEENLSAVTEAVEKVSHCIVSRFLKIIFRLGIFTTENILLHKLVKGNMYNCRYTVFVCIVKLKAGSTSVLFS